MADDESTISQVGDDWNPMDSTDSLDSQDGALSEDNREDNTGDVEGAVPPGYDWPTHGGYLGCLLSIMASCLVGGFLGTTLFAALSYRRILPSVVTLLLTIVVFMAVAIGFGRLGWILGKRFYRDYSGNQPQGGRQSGDQTSGATEPDLGDATHVSDVSKGPP